jgi:hypothetical protein
MPSELCRRSMREGPSALHTELLELFMGISQTSATGVSGI